MKPSIRPLTKSPDDLDASLRRNRILALLETDTLSAMARQMEQVQLATGDWIHRADKPVRHVYFPVEGVISVLAPAGSDGKVIEVATVGAEGTTGLSVFLGAPRAANDAFVQVSGAGWRMEAAAFLKHADADAQLTGVMQRYAQAFLVQVTQGLACNSTHSARQRCARWLLMTHDRVSGDTFDLKQEFLGQMLGERRAEVSKVASQLRARGLIDYSRGAITVLDRARLEEEACGCYENVRRQYQLMLR